MDDTRVEFRIDVGEWKSMTRAMRPALVLLTLNAQSVGLRSYERAVEAGTSTHLWRGTLRTDLAAGEHRIEVWAFDHWDGELRAVATYRLDEFPLP